MSYKALYRTYRPQTFEDVAGQSHVTITLKNAIKENRIAHAYLFAGPRGTGKTTIAKILAKAINCTGDHPPCNECPNCKAITQGDHPDVIEIDAASNNGVNEVRDLIDKVKYAPINAKYKVYIIDEVHMMTPEAFNALLKTLEEPPAHIVFILATTEPHKILPTIISRCQRFDFKRVDEHDIISRLEYVLKEENVDLVVLAGYLKIISPKFVSEFENKMMNIHPSLIPSFCGDGFYGEKVHQAVIDYGAKVSGATVHFVNEEADAGPIIMQDTVKVMDDDDAKTLAKRVLEVEHTILPRCVKLFCEGKISVEGRKVKVSE